MHLSTVLAASAVFSLQTLHVTAFPLENTTMISTAELQKRAAGTLNDPHILTISCRDVEEVCEARCLARLCFGTPDPYEYNSDKNHNKKNRVESGFRYAFRFTDADREKRGTTIPPSHSNWTSAEETVRASAQLGGWGAPLVGTDEDHNKEEGARYSAQLSAQHVQNHEFVSEVYTDLNPSMKYCNALQSKPPDTSVCDDDDSDEDDPKRHIYWKTPTKKRNTYQFHLLKYGVDTFDSFSKSFGTKRSYVEDMSSIEYESEGLVKGTQNSKRDYIEDGFATQKEEDDSMHDGDDWYVTDFT